MPGCRSSRRRASWSRRSLHNIFTLRGAVVRDPHAWARYLTEAIELFGGRADVVFASHHWPTWGRERVLEFLGLQRDLYAYLHDQTMRLINQGHTGAEIAEQFQLPPALQRAWHTHGYYGSVSHNVKAIYQRYMGWYDGNPARLWQHPPQEAAKRYVAFMGGADVVMDKARASYQEGDLRWAAQVLDHVVFAEPGHQAARALLADVLEQLGQLPPELFFDAVAIQVNGPAAWDLDLAARWVFPDHDATYRTTLRNGVFSYVRGGSGDVILTLTVPRPALAALAAGDPGAALAAGLALDGDTTALQQVFGVLQPGDPDFNIIEP